MTRKKVSPPVVPLVPNATVFDFETPSLKRDSGIISIGAVHFDRFSVANTKKLLEDPKNCFTINVDLTRQFFLGFHFDQDTAKWWRDKNAAEIPKVMENRVDIAEAIQYLHNFLKQHDTVRFCRHTHADYTWYENICSVLNIPQVIRYNRVFDVSTVILTAFNEPKGYIALEGHENRHNALDDCIGDAVQIATAMAKVNG